MQSFYFWDSDPNCLNYYYYYYFFCNNFIFWPKSSLGKRFGDDIFTLFAFSVVHAFDKMSKM